MEEFKLAVRQFAIKKVFHLGVEKSCKKRYRAYCKSSDEMTGPLSVRDPRDTPQGREKN